MSGTHANHLQHQHHGQQTSLLPYFNFPPNMTSPNASYSPLPPSALPNQNLGMQYYYQPPSTNMNWPNSMLSRTLPSLSVKTEPLEQEAQGSFDSQTTQSPRDKDRYISHTLRYNPATTYNGRLHLQGSTNQMAATQHTHAYGNDLGMVSYLTPSEMNHYAWQQQQQHEHQSSRSSWSSTMLERTLTSDSGATLAPLDAMKPSSPASSGSCRHDPPLLADVSITLTPSTYPQTQGDNLHASTTYLSPMGVLGTGNAAGIKASSPPLSSVYWNTNHYPLDNINPPVVALSLREIQCIPGTDYSSDTLQEYSCSEHDASDSDEDGDGEDDDEKDGGEAVMSTVNHGYRVSSLLDMPAATSNLRNEPANNGVTDSSKIPSVVPIFPSDFPRAAAKLASRRITELAKPGGAEYAEEDAKPKVKPNTSPKRKRTVRPRGKSSAVKKRAITVTSAAVCHIPNPIPNYTINKKSRGRAVTTDPNEIDSNIVHVCPVPSCGACFKRREHVKRHIRGLHTEDKVSRPFKGLLTACLPSFPSRSPTIAGTRVA